MKNHTPGPWKYEPSSGAIFYDDSDVEPLIASTNLECVSEEQGNADGLLISAAPDMLAALQMALTDKADQYRDTFDSRMDIDPTVKAIRAAIAKATGGTAPAPAVTVAECIKMLEDVDATLSSSLISKGYVFGTCVDEWHISVQREVETLAKVQALIAKAEGRANG